VCRGGGFRIRLVASLSFRDGGTVGVLRNLERRISGGTFLLYVGGQVQVRRLSVVTRLTRTATDA
jgi:hypothetical protein